MARHGDEESSPNQDKSIKASQQDDQAAELTALELSQIYTLVDSILPFEACLYYQVLPLMIDGSRLIVGTVNPDDPAAEQYVTKQLSYINYSIRFQTISSDWHRDLLSKYLNHTAQKRQQSKERSPTPPPTTAPSSPVASDSSEADDRNQQLTFIVDQPEEFVEPPRQPTPRPPARSQPTPPPAAKPAAAQARPALDATAKRATAAQPSSSQRASRAAQPLAAANAPLALQIDEHYREVNNALLSSLPPQPLMQALLGKVLDEGIGRLYFERRSQSGRILWSRDGVLQAVVDSLDTQILQGVINEFKLLTHLSLISVSKAKQVEIERTYQNQRILIRFRVMPSTHGEEATVQVLRGTALRFYQQQQIERLGRDALDAAQLLQQRLDEIRDRARNSLNVKPTRSEILPTLMSLLQQLEAQVREIEAAYDVNDQTEPPTSNPPPSSPGKG